MNDELRKRVTTAIVLAAAAGIIAIVLFGVPARTLLTLGAVLICPLSMLFMHGRHGGQEGHGGHQEHDTRDAHANEALVGDR